MIFTSPRKKVIIWGTGAYTMWLLKYIPDILDQVVCFVDNNKEKQGKDLCGKKIYAPEYLKRDENESIILICVMKYANSIARQIEEMKINKKYILLG